ncbi:hypothetical protein VTN77DRAFT_5845 [Rasamsonia byssochlamydoides]|uniref:uncharacterized protein n=1 Tax=Rasamsonia byssochlamydoides TaxID=89139 RepID=UPI0037434B88
MSSRKTTTGSPRRPSRKAPSVSDAASQLGCSRLEKIPSPARFGLLVLSSLVLSSALFTATSAITVGDLSSVSKHLENWWEVGGLIAWRAVELGLAWIAGFDGRDVAFFTLITHVPTSFLLLHFYGVRPTTIVTSFLIDITAMTVPFVLLRRPSSVHARSESVANHSILQDRLTTIYTTVAASAIFSVFIYLSFSTWLPAFLVTHFEDIPDIRAVHAGPAGLPGLFVSLLVEGYAARDLLFVSSAGWSAEETPEKQSPDRQGEYLITSVYNRTWGTLSPKARILISRTVLLAAITLLNTIVQVSGTIKGVDVQGSAGWGAIWAAAVLTIGLTFGWIEAVPGV